jgi:hypothetical protein
MKAHPDATNPKEHDQAAMKAENSRNCAYELKELQLFDELVRL